MQKKVKRGGIESEGKGGGIESEEGGGGGLNWTLKSEICDA